MGSKQREGDEDDQRNKMTRFMGNSTECLSGPHCTTGVLSRNSLCNNSHSTRGGKR
jgi:hypothetical protein